MGGAILTPQKKVEIAPPKEKSAGASISLRRRMMFESIEKFVVNVYASCPRIEAMWLILSSKLGQKAFQNFVKAETADEYLAVFIEISEDLSVKEISWEEACEKFNLVKEHVFSANSVGLGGIRDSVINLGTTGSNLALSIPSLLRNELLIDPWTDPDIQGDVKMLLKTLEKLQNELVHLMSRDLFTRFISSKHYKTWRAMEASHASAITQLDDTTSYQEVAYQVTGVDLSLNNGGNNNHQNYNSGGNTPSAHNHSSAAHSAVSSHMLDSNNNHHHPNPNNPQQTEESSSSSSSFCVDDLFQEAARQAVQSVKESSAMAGSPLIIGQEAGQLGQGMGQLGQGYSNKSSNMDNTISTIAASSPSHSTKQQPAQQTSAIMASIQRQASGRGSPRVTFHLTNNSGPGSASSSQKGPGTARDGGGIAGMGIASVSSVKLTGFGDEAVAGTMMDAAEVAADVVKQGEEEESGEDLLGVDKGGDDSLTPLVPISPHSNGHNSSGQHLIQLPPIGGGAASTRGGRGLSFTFLSSGTSSSANSTPSHSALTTPMAGGTGARTGAASSFSASMAAMIGHPTAVSGKAAGLVTGPEGRRSSRRLSYFSTKSNERSPSMKARYRMHSILQPMDLSTTAFAFMPNQDLNRILGQRDSWLGAFLAAVEALPIAVSLAKADRSRGGEGFPLIFVNRYFEKMTGYSREDVIGKPCKDILQDPKRAEPEKIAILRDGLQRRHFCQAVVTNKANDGRYFKCLVTCKPLLSDYCPPPPAPASAQAPPTPTSGRAAPSSDQQSQAPQPQPQLLYVLTLQFDVSREVDNAVSKMNLAQELLMTLPDILMVGDGMTQEDEDDDLLNEDDDEDEEEEEDGKGKGKKAVLVDVDAIKARQKKGITAAGGGGGDAKKKKGNSNSSSSASASSWLSSLTASLASSAALLNKRQKEQSLQLAEDKGKGNNNTSSQSYYSKGQSRG